MKTPAPYMTPLPDPHKSIQIPLPFQATPTPEIFHARGKLQFMLDTYDWINDPGSKCGVYDIGYKVTGESQWKYRIQFEEIPKEFIGREELIYQKGPPASSGIDPTRYVYRLFMPYSETPSPTPSGPTSTPTTGPTETPYPTDTPFPTPAAVGFYDKGFENGFDGWDWDGLWHPASSNPASPYYTSYAEVAEGDVSFWYGRNASGDYDTGDINSGSLTSPVVVVGDYSMLMFSSWEQTEGTSPGFDTRKVLISIDYGETWTPIWSSTENPSSSRNVTIDLGGYEGLPVMLRFEFDTVDDQFNDYRGWFVDDVSIGVGPVPSTTVIGLVILLVAMSLGLTILRKK